MSLFTILLGGDLEVTPRLQSQIAGSRVIAADTGIRHARALGVVPELWVGDFDSVQEGDDARYSGVLTKAFPAEKDSTDGELAVTEALTLGATRLILAGAFGGPRADHAFLHLTLALRLAEAGCDVLLTSGAQEGRPLLLGTSSFDYADETLFSILGFSDLSDLTVRGAKWPLSARDVAFGSSLTISNEVRGNLSVSLGAGRALLIAHPYPAEGF